MIGYICFSQEGSWGVGVASKDKGDTCSGSLSWISAMRVIENNFIGTSSCRQEGSQRNVKEKKKALIKLC